MAQTPLQSVRSGGRTKMLMASGSFFLICAGTLNVNVEQQIVCHFCSASRRKRRAVP